MVKLNHSILYRIVTVIFWFNAILAITSASTLPGGFRFFTSESYSMAPTISPEDVTIVQEKYMNSYEKDDIIAFYKEVELANGTTSEEIITHRINRLGGNVYITKGDSNTAEDVQKVKPRLIIGKVVAVIPEIGTYVKFLKSRHGTILFIILPALYIIGSEIAKIFKHVKKDRSNQDNT